MSDLRKSGPDQISGRIATSPDGPSTLDDCRRNYSTRFASVTISRERKSVTVAAILMWRSSERKNCATEKLGEGTRVLVVEMDQTHAFHLPCRLVPFDGSSMGRQVGPQGTCTSAAWSPDGKWMYFGARVGGSAHLWRQRFPDGTPEQITFGPIEEEGIALAPDGRSLVTSAGSRRSVIWIHDAAGERAISSEGYATAPRLSQDGTRVFYLSVRDLVSRSGNWVPSWAELRSVDLGAGKTDTVLAGVSIMDYDISRDEKEVAFTTMDSGGESQIWLASLDRRTPPRRIARGGDEVSFGADGDLVFRSLAKKTDVLVRIKKDGSGRESVTVPILEKASVSPDGAWVIGFSPGAGADDV
jgi:Tol biopolymer transport system component